MKMQKIPRSVIILFFIFMALSFACTSIPILVSDDRDHNDSNTVILDAEVISRWAAGYTLTYEFYDDFVDDFGSDYSSAEIMELTRHCSINGLLDNTAIIEDDYITDILLMRKAVKILGTQFACTFTYEASDNGSVIVRVKKLQEKYSGSFYKEVDYYEKNDYKRTVLRQIHTSVIAVPKTVNQYAHEFF